MLGIVDTLPQDRRSSSNETLTTTEDRQKEGTILSVRHRTIFEYGGLVWNNLNTLHLEPRSYPMQKTLEAIVEVLPATRLGRYEDLFGNVVHHFEITEQHVRLEIESSVTVRNRILSLSENAMGAEPVKSNENDFTETTWQFLQDSRWVSVNPEIWKQAVDLTADKATFYSKAITLMEWIYTEFTYATGITNVNTHLEAVFELRKGVCQDFTHVMIGLCRSIGIPARYASGYIYNGPRDTLKGSQASHAWCEVFLPSDGWIGFDPTNNNLADERYIKIAVGRDYEDVAPIRGSYFGSKHCKMEVQVIVDCLER